MKRFAVLILVIFLLFVLGCSATMIHSKPTGAKLYVDNKYIGETPVEYEDASPFFVKHEVEIQAEGYETYTTTLKRSELSFWALVGTVIDIWPLFWLLGYPEETHYTMVPINPTAMTEHLQE